MFRSSAVLVLAVLALAGCGAVEASTSTPASTSKVSASTPHLPCSLPYGTRVALVSPAPGSAGVAAGASVLVAASRDLPKSVAVIATDAKGNAGTAALERTPPPAHAPQAPFPAPVYYRASGLALHAHRRYTLALDDVAQNGCAPYARIAGVARFST